jgi:hypothetical protein
MDIMQQLLNYQFHGHEHVLSVVRIDSERAVIVTYDNVYRVKIHHDSGFTIERIGNS